MLSKNWKGSRDMAESERCVCCGKVIPEGRQVCVICGYKAEKKVKKCRYCGKEIKSKDCGGICANCYDKKPLVKKLVKIFRVIKKECGVEGK